MWLTVLLGSFFNRRFFFGGPFGFCSFTTGFDSPIPRLTKWMTCSLLSAHTSPFPTPQTTTLHCCTGWFATSGSVTEETQRWPTSHWSSSLACLGFFSLSQTLRSPRLTLDSLHQRVVRLLSFNVHATTKLKTGTMPSLYYHYENTHDCHDKENIEISWKRTSRVGVPWSQQTTAHWSCEFHDHFSVPC